MGLQTDIRFPIPGNVGKLVGPKLYLNQTLGTLGVLPKLVMIFHSGDRVLHNIFSFLALLIS